MIYRRVEAGLEGAPGFDAPAFVFGDSVGFERSRHGGLSLDRLLIETRTLAVLLIKTVRAYGTK